MKALAAALLFPVALLGVSVPPSTALESVARDLAARFNAAGEVRVELVRPWAGFDAPAASRAEVVVAEYPQALAPTVLLRVRCLADGVVQREDTLTVRVQVLADAWVATSPTRPGEPLDPSVLETRQVDLLRDRDAVPVGAGERGYVFSRSVPAGRLVTWRDLARRPLVKKGDVIEVEAIDGTLAVVMKALAMESGAAGESVRVRNLESRREFTALVVSNARAQVRF
jgi:flagellar basal body P-ring formation protein FlgA